MTITKHQFQRPIGPEHDCILHDKISRLTTPDLVMSSVQITELTHRTLALIQAMHPRLASCKILEEPTRQTLGRLHIIVGTTLYIRNELM